MRFAHPFTRSRALVPLAAFLWFFATALLCAESYAADWPLLPDDFSEPAAASR